MWLNLLASTKFAIAIKANNLGRVLTYNYRAVSSSAIGHLLAGLVKGRGASKSFKSSKEARIELNCLAFQIRRIERIKLI